MKFQGITDVFFDLDHTLWDFEKNTKLTYEKIFRDKLISISIADFMETYRPVNFKYWDLFNKNQLLIEQVRFLRLQEVFEILKFDISDQKIIEIYTDYYQKLTDNNFLIEGTREILEYLSKKYTLHIITNGFAEVQQKKINRSGITKYFKEVITSETTGYKKPDKRVFEYALTKTKSNPNQALMIGDDFKSDVLGAYEAGIRSIYFNSHLKNKNTSGFVTISELIKLKQYL